MATRRQAQPRLAIGVDVGGSGIKAAVVDVDRGELAGERIRVPTPDPSAPPAVVRTIGDLIDRLGAAWPAGPEAIAHLPAGVGFPSAIVDGVVMTAANVDKGWVGYAADLELSKALGRRVLVANDADVAGLAEVRFGAGAGRKGVVMVLTIGTGIGSGLFVDGKLVPNTELGHLEMRGKDAEVRASDAARNRRNLSWEQWAKVFDEYLHLVEKLFWPDLFILGGGVSKRSEKFLPRLSVRAPVVPAQLLNDAGIVGAALVASERLGSGQPEARRRRNGAKPADGSEAVERVSEGRPDAG